MDCRVIFGVLLVTLSVQAAPTDDFPLKPSHGPLLLNDEDREALLRATQQITQHNNDHSPSEATHGVLEEMVKSAESAADILTNVMSEAQALEEKSHNTIESLRSSAAESTDICVRDIFGASTRASPIYCGVKFLSQVTIGLYEMRQTLGPLKVTVSKLAADLAKCLKIQGFAEKFVCNLQAARDGWENSEYTRARLAQHLTEIRFLAVEISKCIATNSALQSHLVNKVAECTQTKK